MMLPSAPVLYGQDPRIQRIKSMADALSKKTPHSAGEGFMNGLALALMGKQVKNSEADYDQAQKELGNALQVGSGAPAGLDASTGIKWDTAREGDRNAMMANMLQNKYNAPIAQQMMMNDFQRKDDLSAEIEKTKALMPYEIQLARAKAAASAAGTGGGATGFLVQRYMDEAAKQGRPVTFQQALYAVQTGMRQGLNLGDDGTVSAIGGVPEAKGAIKGGEKQGEKDVELDMNPQIAGAEKQAELNAVRNDKNTDLDISDAQTLPVIGELRELNKKTFNIPYPNVAQGPAKVLGVGKQQTTALDLMQQARLDMAAPLAKQLGVNPTDRDFQSTLDRIFDITATQESRAAQIDALERRIQSKAAVRRPKTPAAAPSGDAVDYREFFK